MSMIDELLLLLFPFILLKVRAPNADATLLLLLL